MKPASVLKGSGRLESNRFNLDVTSGRLDNVNITKGFLSVPDFIDKNGQVIIGIDGHADVPSVMRAVDPLTNGQLSKNGLSGGRIDGQATAHVELRFPTRKPIDSKTLSVTYKGIVKKAHFAQAALGWDLSDGDLNVEGNLLSDFLKISGIGTVGPYRGQISYASVFAPKVLRVAFNGDFDASTFGGSPYVRVPIDGHFQIE
jgi:hypothetical protein